MIKKQLIENLTEQPNKKITYYLNKHKNNHDSKSALIIFNHGLGDCVEFLPLFEKVKTDFPMWDIKLGYHPTIDLNGLHPDVYKINEVPPFSLIPYGMSVVQINENVSRFFNINELFEKFDFIFIVKFIDYNHPGTNKETFFKNKSKVDVCKVLEFGYQDNTPLIPYKIKENNNIDEKKVIFHCGGTTDKSIKNPTDDEQKMIWNEIIDAGFTPLDVHINASTTLLNSHLDLPEWMNPDNSLRFTNFGLNNLLDEISTAKYCIGCLSGPLHTSVNILGGQNCIGLEKKFPIKNYISDNNITVCNINPYTTGFIYNWLTSKKD